MRTSTSLLFILSICLFGECTFAFEALQGELVAGTGCPALQSIRKQTNPGDITLEAGKRYPVTGRNEPSGRYFQVKVAGAAPELRWVAADCGQLAASNESDSAPGPLASGRYLLAISWQPAFCESRPEKTECKTQNAERFDAVHFSLHGLWPQPESNAYCGISAADREADKKGRWDRLPEPAMSDATRRRLAVLMPGTASQLQRHEYTKHGSCFPGSADSYFRTAIHLLDELNGSQLQQTMAANLDRQVSAADLRQAFERSVGPGSGQALQIQCVGDIDSRRTLISELRVSLRGPLTEATRLGEALDTSAGGRDDCSHGIVDAAGAH